MKSMKHAILGPRLINLMPIDLRKKIIFDAGNIDFQLIINWVRTIQSHLIETTKTKVI